MGSKRGADREGKGWVNIRKGQFALASEKAVLASLGVAIWFFFFFWRENNFLIVESLNLVFGFFLLCWCFCSRTTQIRYNYTHTHTHTHTHTYTYPLLLHLPPRSHPSSLGCTEHQAAFSIMQQLPTGYLFYTWYCTYINAAFLIHPSLSYPAVSTSPFSMSASSFLPCR